MSADQFVLVLPPHRLETDCVIQALRSAGIEADCERRTAPPAIVVVLSLGAEVAPPSDLEATGAPFIRLTEADHGRFAEILRQCGSVSQLVDQLHLLDGKRAVASPTTQRPSLAALTTREREVAMLVGQGLRNEEIAERLGISYHTTRTHVSNTFAKLELSDRQALAALVRSDNSTRAGSPGPTVQGRWA